MSLLPSLSDGSPRPGAFALGSTLAFASGAAGLVWQVLWTNAFAIAFGHEVAGLIGVLAAFFAGLAAGAFVLAARIERAPRPGHWYALLEGLVGAWALLLAFALPPLLPALARLLGPQPPALLHTAVAVLVPTLLLLPATFAMGATLPALERAVRVRVRDRDAVAALYATNTAGAAVGVLAAVFWLLPHWGVRATSTLFAGVHLVVGALAWWKLGGSTSSAAPSAHIEMPPADARRRLAQLFVTGLLGIAYEVLVVRVLGQVTENTVLTYAVVLMAFLIATTVGATWSTRRAWPAASLPGWVAAAIAASAPALWLADRLAAVPMQAGATGAWAALGGEALAAGGVLLLPGAAMGALFAAQAREATRAGIPLGSALGWNTLGCAAAAPLAGFAVIPAWGTAAAWAIVVVGYAGLHRPPRRVPWLTAGVAAGALGVLGLAPLLRFVDVPEGGRVLSYAQGRLAAVSVVEDAAGVARLHINNRVQEGSSAGGLVELRLAQLPLLLHPRPQDVLVLGVGTGYTSRAAALDPRTQVEAVELLPEVLQATALFGATPGAPAPERPPRWRVADARRFVLASDRPYDVVIADLFHPARNGAGSLYTAEHFRAVRERLAPGGVFCQWLALHQMDLPALRSIVAAYLQAFPEASAILASNSLDTPVIGLVSARDGAVRIDPATMRARLAAAPPPLAAALRQARLVDESAVLGAFVAGPDASRALAGSAPANTDDRPLVAAHAAWTAYAPAAAPRERLQALMAQLGPGHDIRCDGPGCDRLQAYREARAAYLDLGLRVRPDDDPRRMLLQLREPLLALLEHSPEFQPAAEPLLALARAVQASDPTLAADVLLAVQRARAGPFQFHASTIHAP